MRPWIVGLLGTVLALSTIAGVVAQEEPPRARDCSRRRHRVAPHLRPVASVREHAPRRGKVADAERPAQYDNGERVGPFQPEQCGTRRGAAGAHGRYSATAPAPSNLKVVRP